MSHWRVAKVQSSMRIHVVSQNIPCSNLRCMGIDVDEYLDQILGHTIAIRTC